MVDNVQLNSPPDPALQPQLSPNPWSEQANTKDSEPQAVPTEILSQFDPLAKDVTEAWATEESHPPPPVSRTPSPPPKPPKDELTESPFQDDPPTSPPKDDNILSPGSSSSFASLAALAKSFSIPTLSRSRPVSMEVAKAIPSPSTISSFVAQQQDAKQQQAQQQTQQLAHLEPQPRSANGSDSVPEARQEGSDDEDEDEQIAKDDDPPFDFQKFLEQMKSRSAEPVAKYLKSFLSNFAKRTFTVNDQIKIINDFLAFIAKQMRECDVWRNATEPEFDNAMEGMEKLVMNQLYQHTFTPQVAIAVPPRQITTDDLERDRVLSQRTALFGWIEEKHLDVPEGEGSKGFLMFAEQELLKINHYKAPRDKLICILNCCKVIYGLIRHLHKDEGADSFVPILIFVVLKANPEHLLSNVEFINRFRNPNKLQSEAGYYLSSLMGAVSFIETMDHTSLSNITQEEFERNVEHAIQALPASEASSPAVTTSQPHSSLPQAPPSPHQGEEPAQPLSLPTPGPTFSEDAKRLLQKTGDTISKPLNAISRIFNEALDGAESKLTYLPGPFAPFELGRERQGDGPPVPHWSHPDQVRAHSNPGSRAGTPAPLNLNLQTPIRPEGSPNALPQIHTPYKPRVRRIPSANHSPTPEYLPGPGGGYHPVYIDETPSRPGPGGPFTHQPLALGSSQPFSPQQPYTPPRISAMVGGPDTPSSAHLSRSPTPNLDLVGLQTQIDHAHEQQASAARDTLLQIFPSVDTEIIGWVLEANGGDLGRSIEALLEMSTAS